MRVGKSGGFIPMEQMIAVMGILSAAAVPGCQTFMARGKPSRAMLPYGGCG